MVTLRALIYKYPTSRAWWQVTTGASAGEFLEMLELYRLIYYWLSHCSSPELKRTDMGMLGGYISSQPPLGFRIIPGVAITPFVISWRLKRRCDEVTEALHTLR